MAGRHASGSRRGAGASISKVAERMGRTPNAITLLLRRALEKLKSEFGDTESLSLPDRSLLDGEGSDDG